MMLQREMASFETRYEPRLRFTSTRATRIPWTCQLHHHAGRFRNASLSVTSYYRSRGADRVLSPLSSPARVHQVVKNSTQKYKELYNKNSGHSRYVSG